MSTLFAFLHHLAAFTLVSALAVEFVLIRQELTLANARKLPIVDAVLGGSATLLLIVGLLLFVAEEPHTVAALRAHLVRALGETDPGAARTAARD